ncbi:hypothetical protein K9N50_06770 [bacterium]|nr:hypothetical protein [bacterium]
MLRLTILKIAAILLIFLMSSVYADIGRYSDESMATGGGARSLALGSACMAQIDDAWALFWNPSGLMNIDRTEFGLMHSERFAGVVDYDAAAYATPLPDNTVWALGLIRLGVNGIPFTKLEDPDQPHSDLNRIEVDKYVNEAEYTFFIAKAGNYERWRWGIAPKLLFRHFGMDYRAYGLGVDVGAGGKVIPTLPVNVGITIRDLLGTVLAWEQTGRKEIIAPTVRAGIGGDFKLSSLEARIIPAVDMSYRFDLLGDKEAIALYYGLEYIVKETFALRAGNNDGQFTFGGGLNLKPVTIDYAFTGHDYLGSTHRISITTFWGKTEK